MQRTNPQWQYLPLTKIDAHALAGFKIAISGFFSHRV
jgi:hypothetical protein